MQKSGWDLECHTATHGWSQLHPGRNQVSIEKYEEELKRVNDWFKKHDFLIPQHHSYAGGQVNKKIIEIVSKYRKSGRLADSNYYHWPRQTAELLEDSSISNNYLIPAYGDLHNLKHQKKLISLANRKNLDLCFYMHNIDNNQSPKIVGSISTRHLEELLTYCHSTGIEVSTMNKISDFDRWMNPSKFGWKKKIRKI